MKFSMLSFKQLETIKLNLYMVGLSILRCFIDFRDTGRIKSKLINNYVYHWVKYEALCEDLPILSLKKMIYIDVFKNYVKQKY